VATRNPYSYGGPVSGPHFIGRDAEVADLVSRMVSGISVVVTAPRRYGKTRSSTAPPSSFVRTTVR